MPCGSDTIDGGGSAWTDMVSICCEYDAGGWLVVTLSREKRQALACCVILFTHAFPHSNRPPTTNRPKTPGPRPTPTCRSPTSKRCCVMFELLLTGLDSSAGCSHSMSLTFKLASLVIRTVAKPIGNRIKQSAREHETFRRYCVSFAQGLHRVDMRMRLGILHDAAAQERMHAREAAEAAAKKRQSEAPTVKTEAQQKADDAAAADLKEKRSEAPSKP
ncbi:hypothetical protein KCU71_g23846, partial [Aureobasidium melanogenum]